MSIRDEERRLRSGHGGAVVWITGLSGAGKTTLTGALECSLFDLGCRVVVLNGDTLRSGLCADLGFSLPERFENIRRISEVARLFCQAGQIVIAPAISPCGLTANARGTSYRRRSLSRCIAAVRWWWAMRAIRRGCTAAFLG